MIDVDAGEGTSEQQSNNTRRSESPTFRDALKKIRFLLLTPKQFADSVPRANLLTTDESFAILMNISSGDVNKIKEMPEGFSTSTKTRSISQPMISSHNAPIVNYYNDNSSDASYLGLPGQPIQTVSPYNVNNFNAGNFHVRSRNPTNRYRDHQGRDVMMDATETRRFYCVRTIREQIDYFNTSVSDCALTFAVDRNICITGIQVATQVLGEQSMQSGNLPERYSELLYAHLLDSYGTRLTYTHCTSNVRFDSLLEISFDHPVQVHRDRLYKIGVAFNKGKRQIE